MRNKTAKNNNRMLGGNIKRAQSTTNKRKHISILSYNISWESMTGSDKNWDLCNNNTDINNPKHNSICVSNISNVINENPADFITLQEATDYKQLIKQCPKLSKMLYQTHISGLDCLATFWNSKYKCIKTITGEFEKGRPWMAILFSNKICLINVHLGHYNGNTVYNKLQTLIITVKQTINNMFNNTNTFNNTINNTFNNNTQTRFIISGDFNYDIKKFSSNTLPNTIKLDNIDFYYHQKHILTCCINRITHYDHVIDTYNKPLDIHIPNVKYLASDHKPILVKLLK